MVSVVPLEKTDSTLLSCRLRFLTRLYLHELANAVTQKHGAVVRLFEDDVEATFLIHVVHSYKPASGWLVRCASTRLGRGGL